MIGVVLASSLAVGSGVGGGSFFIAIFILVLDLDAHHAIPLSKATILGVGLAALSVNYFKPHPKTAHRPLIDYNLAAMFEPLTMCGTLLGVLLNILFPAWLVIVPLCLLLGFTTYKTYKKGLAIHAKEQAEAQSPAKSSLKEPLLDPVDDPYAAVPTEGSDAARKAR